MNNNVETTLKKASTLLKAMSNERRLVILSLLVRGEWSVGSLEECVGLSQSALSQHLARLRRDNLVVTRREAQAIFYSLNGSAATEIMATLEKLFGKLNDVANDTRKTSKAA